MSDSRAPPPAAAYGFQLSSVFAALLWFSASFCEVAAKKKEKEGWRLPRHSFSGTLSYDDTLGDWLLSAASMALRDRVQLLPPVKDRSALAFSKVPIESEEFKVSFTMQASSRERERTEANDAYLVFWLDEQDYAATFDEKSKVEHESKDWSKALQASGHTLLGNKPNFKGLAVVLSTSGQKQVISGLHSTGVKHLSLEDLESEERRGQRQELKWMSSAVAVQLHIGRAGDVTCRARSWDIFHQMADTTWKVTKDGGITSAVTFKGDGSVHPAGKWSMHGEVLVVEDGGLAILGSPDYQKGKLSFRLAGGSRATLMDKRHGRRVLLLLDTETLKVDWKEVFSLPQGTYERGARSYMGFTGYSGSKSHLSVDLHSLDTVNLDEKSIGEKEGSDALENGTDSEWLKLLEKERIFLNQATQGEAVRELTNLLNEHLGHYETITGKLKEDLNAMDVRLTSLQTDLSTYVAATTAFNFEADQFDPSLIRQNIHGIRHVLSKGKEAHDAKLAEVQQGAKELKRTGGGAHLTEEGKRKAKSVQEQSQDVEEFAAQGARTTNILLCVLVIAVAGLGFLFFGRMRYYEKKHYI